jgi:uncharacterized delta-60 repeat protein
LIKTLFRSIVLLIFFYNSPLFAQQGKVDITFNALDDGQNGDGFDATIRTLSLQSDQNLIVGGEYLSLNGIPISYLTRLKPDGTVDETFNTGKGFNGKVYATYIQPDGKIIVGGNFTAFNGISSGRLVRLNNDGSYDSTFNTTIAATTGIVYDICPQADGKIIIVGSFTKYNNVIVSRIARVLSNGALDSTFMTGSGSATNITNARVLNDGKILLTGNFTKFNTYDTNKIVRLLSDGRVDVDFNIGTGFNDNVNAVSVQTDGKIILGGNFTTYNEIPANRIIRINPDGTIDSSFITGSGFTKDAIQVIKTDPTGNIMIGGSFTDSYNGSEVNRICFLNSDGSFKSDFETGSGPGSGSVFALANDNEGAWYIGGSFSVFDGLNQGKLAKINSDGEHDTGYLSSGIGFDNSVLKVLPLSNKKTMVFGNFAKFNGETALRVTRLLEDGLQDLTFNSGLGANNVVRSAVLQSDGKIVFGGNFTKYNETTSGRIARILPDGAVDNSFLSGSGFNGLINVLEIQEDQKIIVAGSFTSYNGSSSSRIIRLLPNGLRDTSFNIGLGADGIIETVVIQPDGKILVGGRFSKFNGNSASRIVRLNPDGSIDFSFVTGDFDNKFVFAIALQSDQKIIIGGSFLTYKGISQKRILRLNSNGTLDTTFESGAGFSKGDVRVILIQPDDRILVGGTFSGLYKTNTALRLIRLEKNGGFDSSFESPLNNKLNTMSFTPDHRLIIGGDFNSISGISKHRIARLKLCLDSTTWKDFVWSNGLPSGGKQIFFKDDYPNLTSANVCSCTIDEGKNVTLLSENTLGIEFDYSGSGILTLENSASLYQSDDDVVNNGIIHLKRKTSPILKLDYTYWSTPVNLQKLIDVSPLTMSDKFFYNNAPGWVAIEGNSNMEIGKGYIIRGPETYSNTIKKEYEASFIGIPNNGNFTTEPLTVARYHLIGNPYPSALSVDKLIDGNSVLNGTVYLWTHNTAANPVGNYNYNVDDYASYNATGGVKGKIAVTGNPNNIDEKPTGFIASGQAFFVSTRLAGSVNFNNSMREADSNNTQFFKSTESIKKTVIEKNRVWLNLTNADGAFKQILVGYIEGATDKYDSKYDGISMNANPYLDFYSMIDANKFVIQGRALPFSDTDFVSLGYRTTIAGNFTIAIDEVDGKMKHQAIYLEDKITGIVHDLTQNNYTFTTAAGTFSDRFVLRYTDKKLATIHFENNENEILVLVKSKIIRILSSTENIKEVIIYDNSGKLLFNKKKIGNTELQIQNLKSANQLLLVKVILENGVEKVKKILF